MASVVTGRPRLPALVFGAVVAAAGSSAATASADSVSELVRQARAHEAAHEDDVAARRYTDALGLDPTSGDAYLGLAALRARRGDPREAERVYSMALEHTPDLTLALAGRARVRRAMGQRGDAEADLEDYVARARDVAALRELAGWYGEDGRPAAQLGAWRRVLTMAIVAHDDALAHEARTTVRALQILVGPADPVVAPPDTREPARRAMAAIARRAG
jgi:tetratricopeptide (TPR) repeat protein